MKVKWQIVKEERVVSNHSSQKAADKKLSALQNWRCGICGSKNAGYAICKHGKQNMVCNADYYNAKVIGITEDGTKII